MALDAVRGFRRILGTGKSLSFVSWQTSSLGGDMNPFNPPTDNLYKFCSLTGVVMVLFALYVPYLLADQLYSKLTAGILEEKRIQIEIQYLEVEINRMKEAIESFKLAETPESVLRSGKTPIPISLAEYRELNVARDKALKDLRLKAAATESSVSEVNRLGRQLEVVYLRAILTLLAGTLLANYGFRRWYNRVQLYQDLALRKEGEKDAN